MNIKRLIGCLMMAIPVVGFFAYACYKMPGLIWFEIVGLGFMFWMWAGYYLVMTSK